MTDQYTFTNPVDQYHTGGFDEQYQDGPGLASDLHVKADHAKSPTAGAAGWTAVKL